MSLKVKASTFKSLLNVWVRCVLVGGIVVGCASCSINGVGFPASQEQYDTKWARIVEDKALGVNIDSRSGFGVNFGYTNKVHVYPVIKTKGDGCFDLLSSEESSKEDMAERNYSDDAIRISVKNMGIGFHSSTNKLKFYAGILSRNELRIEADRSFSYFHFSKEKDIKSKTCAIIFNGS